MNMDTFKWILGAAIVFFVLSKIYEGYKEGASGDDGTMHCMNCGTDAKPKTQTKGHFALELVLWLLFIVPGLIYSVWRLTSKKGVCPVCGSANIIPPQSPAAVAHRANMLKSSQYPA